METVALLSRFEEVLILVFIYLYLLVVWALWNYRNEDLFDVSRRSGQHIVNDMFAAHEEFKAAQVHSTYIPSL